ncbi:MAG: hypothetical protein B7Z73_17220, partial [Planctomycetia bacterium 21-64-5]
MFGTLSIPAYAGVLENDDGGNGPLSAVLISGPSDGRLALNSDGSFTYSNTMYAYGDSFTYEATDGTNYSNIATVSLSFSGSSQPTIEADDNYAVVHDRTLNVSAANGVLAGASDPNGLHLAAVLTSAPSSGSLTLNSDGSFSYTPATHYVGSVTFGVEAYDSSQSSTPVSDSINVTNEPPDAFNDQYYLPTGQTFTTTAANGVLANDSDADGDTLTARLVTGPSHGSLTLNSDGSFSYTPDTGWVGFDSFTYDAS